MINFSDMTSSDIATILLEVGKSISYPWDVQKQGFSSMLAGYRDADIRSVLSGLNFGTDYGTPDFERQYMIILSFLVPAIGFLGFSNFPTINRVNPLHPNCEEVKTGMKVMHPAVKSLLLHTLGITRNTSMCLIFHDYRPEIFDYVAGVTSYTSRVIPLVVTMDELSEIVSAKFAHEEAYNDVFTAPLLLVNDVFSCGRTIKTSGPALASLLAERRRFKRFSVFTDSNLYQDLKKNVVRKDQVTKKAVRYALTRQDILSAIKSLPYGESLSHISSIILSENSYVIDPYSFHPKLRLRNVLENRHGTVVGGAQ